MLLFCCIKESFGAKNATRYPAISLGKQDRKNLKALTPFWFLFYFVFLMKKWGGIGGKKVVPSRSEIFFINRENRCAIFPVCCCAEGAVCCCLCSNNSPQFTCTCYPAQASKVAGHFWSRMAQMAWKLGSSYVFVKFTFCQILGPKKPVLGPKIGKIPAVRSLFYLSG